MTKRYFCVAFITVVFISWIFFVSVQKHLSVYYLIVAFNLLMLLQIENIDRRQILKYIIIILTVTSFPSIIYYILYVLHIRLPYTVLPSLHESKTQLGIYYQHYPFGLIIAGSAMPRPSGLFDEPGYMGTLAGILYAAVLESRDKTIKKWRICLIIIGLFSFSLAFYILFFVRIMIYIAEKGYKRVALILPVLIALFVVFMNVDFHNEQIQEVQARLKIGENGLEGDNRTTMAFDEEYGFFIRGDTKIILRGNGLDAHMKNPKMIGASSYKVLVYNYGIIGTGLLILLLVLIVYSVGFTKNNTAFLLIFLLSMYQRPGVFTMHFISILICGLEKGEVHRELFGVLKALSNRSKYVLMGRGAHTKA